MSFAIGPECIDVMDRSCVEVCPVDCIYEGSRKLYVHPSECIDCGACVTVCPQDAIVRAEDVDLAAHPHVADNARFFAQPLPGREEPLGSPGGCDLTGPIGVDTELVQAHG